MYLSIDFFFTPCYNFGIEGRRNMGSSMYFVRKSITECTIEDAVCKFVEMITPLDIFISYEDENILYLWKCSISSGIRVYINVANPVSFPELPGVHCCDVFFDAVYYDDEDHNTDLLLMITAAYLEKYPDALLVGEAGVSRFYDKEDIDAVLAKPFDRNWLRTKSHITLAED